MSGKAAIPALRTGDRETDAFGQAVKQNIDWLTGQGKGPPAIKPLPLTATLAEVIAQHNKIVERLTF